ncbi:MAG: hypothetical protein ACXU95_06120 [Isosphaeraceae bacterium]
MAGNNEVSQVVRLNGTQYRDEIGRMQTETRTNLQKINKELTDSGNAYRDFTNYVKKQTSSMIGSIEEAGKAFAKNLGRGALAGGALAGVEAMHDGMREAIRTGLSFDDALARVASRADLSAQQVKKLKNEFFELGKTGAKLESIPEAFNAIYGATGNIDQTRSVMSPIAKAAAMGNGDAGQVAEFVKDRLKGEGKEINQGNVQELLQSLVLAQRGGEFNSMQDAMQGMGGINASAQRRAGLSDREMAGILAGSTRAGADKATGVAAAQALVHMSQQGFGGAAALGGMLGVGNFMSNGKFDTSKLTQASANLKKSGRSDSESITLFQGAGLSEQESTGLLAILKNVEKFQAGVKRVATDTKTFDQSFEEVTDTLGHRLEELKNTTVQGFDDIFSPLMNVAKKAAGGDVGGAIAGLPRAAGQAAAGAASHPLLAGGALLATAAGGALLKKFGLGGEGADLAKGVAKGTALKQAGVTPVYVTNAGEIRGEAGGSSMADKFMQREAEAAGMGGVAGQGGKLARALGIGGKALGGAAAVAGAGYAGYQIGTGINDVLDEKTQGRTSEGYEGSAVERLIFKLDKLFGGENAKNFMAAQKVVVEIDSKDPAYMARPKKNDNPRDSRGL